MGTSAAGGIDGQALTATVHHSVEGTRPLVE